MNKKSKLRVTTLTLFSALLICLTTIVACRKSLFDPAPDRQVTRTANQFLINYQSSVKDSVLHVELQVSKEGKAIDVMDEELEFNLKGKKYLGSIYRTLQNKSMDKKYAAITVPQARELCLSLRQVIEETVSTLSPEEIKSPNIQGMYMSLTLARRILKNKLGKSTAELRLNAKTDRKSNATMSNTPPLEPEPEDPEVQPIYAQDVYAGYDLGLSSFVLNEDIIVNKQVLLDIVDADANATITDDRGLYVFQSVLGSLSVSTLSLKDLLVEFDNYIALHPENRGSGTGCSRGWWPSGSTHGCCGNYNGCCWYWSPVCYIHDKICKNCKPAWFCFSGCVPDSAEPVDKPFTFIEDTYPEVPTENMYLPTPLANDIYYKVDFNLLNAHVPQFYTYIYANPVDLRYYTSTSYTTYVPNGYYDSPSEHVGNNHKYYYIVDGLVLQTFDVVIIPD